jgi:5'-deoxynucleotidase YfbR-like HD superfamily hydrolase
MDDSQDARTIYDFINYAEGLKSVMRHCWLKIGRREDVAEHTWRMALMATLIAPKTELKLDLAKVFQMISVHDLTEINTQDIPAHRHMTSQSIASAKETEEVQAIKDLASLLDEKTGERIKLLWQEYEDNITPESLFVNFLDKLEARMQICSTPIERLDQQEFNPEFIDKYTEKMKNLCAGDKFLIMLNDMAGVDRVKLTSSVK